MCSLDLDPSTAPAPTRCRRKTTRHSPRTAALTGQRCTPAITIVSAPTSRTVIRCMTKTTDTGAAAAALPSKRRITRADLQSRISHVARNGKTEVATQVDLDITLHSHLRQHFRGTRLRLVPHIFHKGPKQDLIEFAEQMSPHKRRPLCDCFRCIHHALLVADTNFRIDLRIIFHHQT